MAYGEQEKKVDVMRLKRQIDGNFSLKKLSHEPDPPSPIMKPEEDSNVKQKSKGYSCKLCAQSFQTFLGLFNHSKIHKHPCQQCGKFFTNKGNLVNHSRVHQATPRTPTVTHPCQLCEKACKSKERLASHTRTQHAEPPKVTLLCQERQKVSNEDHPTTSSRKHDILRRAAKVHTCNFCGKVFQYESRLRRHMLIHTKEKAYQFSKCENSFSLKHSLVQHAKTHTEKDLQCEKCELRFTNRKLLESHQQTCHVIQELPTSQSIPGTEFPSEVRLFRHSKIRRPSRVPKVTVCPYCYKECGYSSCLILHMLIHTKEKSFQCQKCKMSFARKSELVGHSKNHSEMDLKCPNCELCFTNSKRLESHVETDHGIQKMPTSANLKFSCSVCGKVFTTKPHLIRHSSTHNTSTNQGVRHGKTDGTKSYKPSLKIGHMRIRSNLRKSKIPAKQKCQYCGILLSQKSDLERHMRTHTREKPFQCLTCGSSFARKYLLSRHYSKTRCQNNSQLFKCKDCEQQFTNETSLTFHVCSINTDEQQFQRSQYNNMPELSKSSPHMDTDKLKPNEAGIYKCKLCGNQLSSAKGLEVHYKRHKVEKKHKCDRSGCNTSYVNKSELIRHQISHSKIRVGIGDYKCKTCQKQFQSRYKLRRHEGSRSHHSKVNPLVCDVCNKSYHSKEQLDIHKKCHTIGLKELTREKNQESSAVETIVIPQTIQVKKWKCVNCDQVFYSESQLLRHMKIHNDKQDIPKERQPDVRLVSVLSESSELFSSTNQLQTPRKSHGEHQCKTCEKDFKCYEELTAHELIHKIPVPVVKLYVCEVCDFTYTSKSDLKNHKTSHSGINNYKCENDYI